MHLAAVVRAFEETLSGCADEVMCNPIGQALLMNSEHTDMNIILGLCVGHDSLVMKYVADGGFWVGAVFARDIRCGKLL